MTPLTRRISELWERRFPHYARQPPMVRHLPNAAEPRFVVIFHPSREEPSRPDTAQSLSLSACPLDHLDPSLSFPFGDWIVTPNRCPVQREHILLALKHHRSEPTVVDTLAAMEFAQETGFRLLLNLPGAGASVRQHLHWQGLRMDSPVLSQRHIRKVVYDDCQLRVCLLADPWNGFRLDARTDEGRQRIAQAAVSWIQPFNLVLQDAGVYFCPRSKEFPPQFPNFKFGGAEVGGVVFAKTRGMFDDINENAIKTAIRAVGLPDELRRDALARLLDLVGCTCTTK